MRTSGHEILRLPPQHHSESEVLLDFSIQSSAAESKAPHSALRAPRLVTLQAQHLCAMPVQPARPKMELELPYRMYRLVRADGSAVERVDKHPFCMSRVYYNATEKPEEVRSSWQISWEGGNEEGSV